MCFIRELFSSLNERFMDRRKGRRTLNSTGKGGEDLVDRGRPIFSGGAVGFAVVDARFGRLREKMNKMEGEAPIGSWRGHRLQ